MCFFLRYALLICPPLKDLPWSPGYHGLRPHGLSRRWSYDEGQDQWLYVVQQFAACVFLPNLRSEELEGVCTSVAHSGTPGHVSGSVCWWLLVAAFFRLWYFVISKILVAIHMWMVSHIQGCQEGCDRKEYVPVCSRDGQFCPSCRALPLRKLPDEESLTANFVQECSADGNVRWLSLVLSEEDSGRH